MTNSSDTFAEGQKSSKSNEKALAIIREAFFALNVNYLRQGAAIADLRSSSTAAKAGIKNGNNHFLAQLTCSKKVLIGVVVTSLIYSLLVQNSHSNFLSKYALGTHCLIPNNYFVWEFTRPVSSCDFCRGVESVLILPNLTREKFEPYAYSSRPMVIKNAVEHWPARKVFSLYFFKNLYEGIDGAYESVQEECQFLHFKSNFASLKEVFAMSDRRALNLPGEQPWYVGWKNCHPQVLEIMKEFYDTPHFLPEDAETPHTNYVFLGYEHGAVMHLDYIPRLMWQGQVLGSKTWSVAPTPECDKVCKAFDFHVDAGDVILLDTRVWYHSTNVRDGQFSLTVTSEYGSIILFAQQCAFGTADKLFETFNATSNVGSLRRQRPLMNESCARKSRLANGTLKMFKYKCFFEPSESQEQQSTKLNLFSDRTYLSPRIVLSPVAPLLVSQ